MDEKEIHFFLNYGYFPHYTPQYKPAKVNKIEYEEKSYQELQKNFHHIFKEVIKENLEKVPENKKIIIPISGGLDSRAILAEVINQIPKKRIKTYTFGIKGSYDYEIGKEIARKAGVLHQALDLNEVSYTQEEMIETAKRCDYQTHLFHHPPLYFLKDFIEDNIVFSGFMGDVVFGSYAGKASIKKEDAKKWYLENKKYTFYLRDSLPEDFIKYIEDIDNESAVSPAEQLILYERGSKLIAPHILMKGWEYKIPLVDKKIMDFMFSLPRQYRIDEKFFIDTMLKYYPDLFNIRAKTTFGHHLKSPKIVLYGERLKNKIISKLNSKGFNFTYKPYNYLDYNKGIIERADFKKIFTENLTDLEKRNILGDISPLKILEQHYKTKNLYQILILLSSLEIILKAKEQ